jgi:hypothetical protein
MWSHWIADSGATAHMTDQRQAFSKFEPFLSFSSYPVKGIGGTKLFAHGQGSIDIFTTVSGVRKKVTIKNVLFVPNLGASLISITAATSNGMAVIFSGEKVIFSRLNKIEMTGSRVDKLYLMDIEVHTEHQNNQEETAYVADPKKSTIEIWHQRLAHLNYKTILEMSSLDLADGLSLPRECSIPEDICHGCAYGKMQRKSFTTGRSRATYIGQLIHSDLCGPMQTPSLTGARYFLLFTDDYSGWRQVYFLRQKSETPDKFKEYVTLLRSETSNFVHALRTDNGGEYCSINFRGWLSKKGIRHESSAPHCPEQNGVAERANRTVVEAARSLIHAKGLPIKFWAEAVACAVYTLNRVPSKASKSTPHQIWHKAKPDLTNLRVFGSTAFVHIPAAERRKIDPKSVKCIFIGYCSTQKAHRFWDPVACKVKVSRDAIFDENRQFDFFHPVANPIEGEPNLDNPPICNEMETASSIPPIHNEKESTQSNQSGMYMAPPETNHPSEDLLQPPEPAPLATQKRVHFHPSANPMSEDTMSIPATPPEEPNVRRSRRLQGHKALHSQMASHDSPYEPSSYADAISSPDAPLWKAAMLEEYQSLIKNDTWTLRKLPQDRNTIKTRWVFTVKPSSFGNPPRYKARMVAKGFTQRPGIDYSETFSPVVKMDSLRTILSLSAARNLDMTQLDVKTAFLYGEISEEIYLNQPEGFVTPGKEREVCKLNKCIYGLKQASRVWNQHFNKFLQDFGLNPSASDPCVYSYQQGEEFTIVAIWVDDGLVCSNNKESTTRILQYLSTHFEMRFGVVDYFVGLKITRDWNKMSVYLSQPEYINKVIHRFNMEECQPKSLPADPNSRLMSKNKSSPEENTDGENFPYREAVGSLIYLAVTSRPDISYAVNQVAQHSENPNRSHWAAVKRIISYLKGTSKLGIKFDGRCSKTITGFTDADYAGDLDTRRSTTGFVFLLNSGPVSWSSRRQPCVSLSTTEAEFIAASETVKEAIWLKRLLTEIGNNGDKPIPILCDNDSTIKLVKNNQFHQRTKHIEVRHYFVREKQEAGEIEVSYVPTQDNLADIFTKPLPNPRFCDLRARLGITEVPHI